MDVHALLGRQGRAGRPLGVVVDIYLTAAVNKYDSHFILGLLTHGRITGALNVVEIAPTVHSPTGASCFGGVTYGRLRRIFDDTSTAGRLASRPVAICSATCWPPVTVRLTRYGEYRDVVKTLSHNLFTHNSILGTLRTSPGCAYYLCFPFVVCCRCACVPPSSPSSSCPQVCLPVFTRRTTAAGHKAPIASDSQ